MPLSFMKKLVALLLLLAALLGAVAVFHRHSTPSAQVPALTVYCAASLKKSVEAIATQYQSETGTEVRLQFGGSGALLSSLRVARQGDLFLAADDSFVADARQAGVVREVIPVVVQHPVLAVRKGNPKGIHSVADLLRDEVKVALADPATASISRVSRNVLGAQWEKLAARAAVTKPSVTDIATDVSLGTVDAAIVWNAVTAQFKDTEAVEVPELSAHQENASACVLTFSHDPDATLSFAHYLVAPDKGGAIFKTNGFTPAGGGK